MRIKEYKNFYQLEKSWIQPVNSIDPTLGREFTRLYDTIWISQGVLYTHDEAGYIKEVKA